LLASIIDDRRASDHRGSSRRAGRPSISYTQEPSAPILTRSGCLCDRGALNETETLSKVTLSRMFPPVALFLFFRVLSGGLFDATFLCVCESGLAPIAKAGPRSPAGGSTSLLGAVSDGGDNSASAMRPLGAGSLFLATGP